MCRNFMAIPGLLNRSNGVANALTDEAGLGRPVKFLFGCAGVTGRRCILLAFADEADLRGPGELFLGCLIVVAANTGSGATHRTEASKAALILSPRKFQ